jgi:hypothetical protein
VKRLLAAALLALAPPAFAEAPSIDGTWVSVAPENIGGPFATRAFTFDGDAWSVVFSTFADDGLTQPGFTINVAGYYRLGGASAAVPGAWNGVFAAFDKTVTAHSPEAVAMFADMGCTLELGQPFDLTDQACGFLHAAMEAMGEYDLVSIQGDQLFLGDRSADLTKARPTMLTPFPVVRK